MKLVECNPSLCDDIYAYVFVLKKNKCIENYVLYVRCTIELLKSRNLLSVE